MTFNEADVNRKEDGKFGEKVGSGPEIDLAPREVTDFRLMADSDDSALRVIAAEHLTDRRVLKRLAKDDSEFVRSMAQSNPALLARDLEDIYQSGTLLTSMAAQNPNFGDMEKGLLEELSVEGLSHDRAAVARSPFTPDSTLRYMRNLEVDSSIRALADEQIAFRENYTPGRIEGLMGAVLPSVDNWGSNEGVYQHQLWIVDAEGKTVSTVFDDPAPVLGEPEMAKRLSESMRRHAVAYSGGSGPVSRYAKMYTDGDVVAASDEMKRVEMDVKFTRAMRESFYGKA